MCKFNDYYYDPLFSKIPAIAIIGIKINGNNNEFTKKL
jgi:DNA-directed RNA polymerase alpha subunit